MAAGSKHLGGADKMNNRQGWGSGAPHLRQNAERTVDTADRMPQHRHSSNPNSIDTWSINETPPSSISSAERSNDRPPAYALQPNSDYFSPFSSHQHHVTPPINTPFLSLYGSGIPQGGHGSTLAGWPTPRTNELGPGESYGYFGYGPQYADAGPPNAYYGQQSVRDARGSYTSHSAIVVQRNSLLQPLAQPPNGGRLPKGFKVQKGHDFWIPGMVIQAISSETMGDGARVNPELLKSANYTDTNFGTGVYTTMRFYVVIVVREQYCICSPIYSYKYEGLASNKLTDPERQLHAVIYSSNLTPDKADDKLTTRQAIKVDPKSYKNTLHTKSRLHLGKTVPIERNTPVRYHGNVNTEDFEHLKRSILEIWNTGLGGPYEFNG